MKRPNRKYRLNSDTAQILARMRYLERIGGNPYNENEPMPKYSKYSNTLHERDKVRDCMGNRLDSKAPF